MKTLRQSIFLPVFALIVFLGFGAGTALANSSSEVVGGWSSEAVGPGRYPLALPVTSRVSTARVTPGSPVR